jgi:hypothetical protein
MLAPYQTILTRKGLQHGRPLQKTFSSPRFARLSSQGSKRLFSSGSSSHSFTFLPWYSRMLQERPILTKAITSGLIAGAGDWLCQYTVHKKQVQHVKLQQRMHHYDQDAPIVTSSWQPPTHDETALLENSEQFRWDLARTGRFVLLGSVLVAPVIHWWYGFLARSLPSTSAVSIAKRVALDQIAFTPIYLPVWLTALWTLEGIDTATDVNASGDETAPETIMQRLTRVTPSLLIANWAYWIPVQAVNFKFIAVPYQVLFSNMAALLWTAYLSFSANESASSTSSRDKELEELPIL